MINLKIGTKVKVNLPKPLPSWVLKQLGNFSGYNWEDHLLLNDQKTVTVLHVFKNILFNGGVYDCVDVETPILLPQTQSNRTTLLLDWFQIVDDEKKTCDCPISSILTRGCQNSTHI